MELTTRTTDPSQSPTELFGWLVSHADENANSANGEIVRAVRKRMRRLAMQEAEEMDVVINRGGRDAA